METRFEQIKESFECFLCDLLIRELKKVKITKPIAKKLLSNDILKDLKFRDLDNLVIEVSRLLGEVAAAEAKDRWPRITTKELTSISFDVSDSKLDELTDFVESMQSSIITEILSGMGKQFKKIDRKLVMGKGIK